MERLVLGITPINENEHCVCGRYNAHTAEDDVSGVEVVEIANGRLLHTRVDGGHLEGRIAVFSRWISQFELVDRVKHNLADPDGYNNSILKGTSH